MPVLRGAERQNGGVGETSEGKKQTPSERFFSIMVTKFCMGPILTKMTILKIEIAWLQKFAWGRT